MVCWNGILFTIKIERIQFILLGSDGKVDVGLRCMKNGTKIQVEQVPAEVLAKMDSFYVCEQCGKVYWDGSHFDKVLSGALQDVLHHNKQ